MPRYASFQQGWAGIDPYYIGCDKEKAARDSSSESHCGEYLKVRPNFVDRQSIHLGNYEKGVRGSRWCLMEA